MRRELGVGLGSAPFFKVNMRIKHHWHIILPCILAVLSALDLVFTLIIIDSGRATEKNPIMRYLLEEHGYVTTSAVKLTLTGFCCYMMWFALREKKNKSLIHLLSCIVLGVYTLLGLWWIYCWIIFFFY